MNGKDKPLERIKSLNKDPSEILEAELALHMDAGCESMEAGQHSGSAIINYKEKYLINKPLS